MLRAIGFKHRSLVMLLSFQVSFLIITFNIASFQIITYDIVSSHRTYIDLIIQRKTQFNHMLINYHIWWINIWSFFLSLTSFQSLCYAIPGVVFGLLFAALLSRPFQEHLAEQTMVCVLMLVVLVMLGDDDDGGYFCWFVMLWWCCLTLCWCSCYCCWFIMLCWYCWRYADVVWRCCVGDIWCSCYFCWFVMLCWCCPVRCCAVLSLVCVCGVFIVVLCVHHGGVCTSLCGVYLPWG